MTMISVKMVRDLVNFKTLLCATLTLVVLSLTTSVSGKMTNQDIKAIEQISVKAMLKHEIKMADQQGIRKRAGKQFEEKETVSNYSHPFQKPGIIDDIRYSYRHYREMILMRGGNFWMGTNDPDSKTGEYPMKQVVVKSFYLDANPVINADYWAFRARKKFVRSDAEKRGWSWVVNMFLSDETRNYYSMPGARGWAAVKKANWNAPEGPDSSLQGRWKHPVVHLSWYDAKLYCEFHGKRLPTELEWEYAARAGMMNRAYPWGDNWQRQRANVWQGAWPDENKKVDGYSITSPVDAYRPQNVIGFFDMIGNVWEWTTSAYVERMVQPHLQTSMVVLKGGSFVDSVSGKVNHPVRNGQRTGQKQDYSAENVGFRCAKSAPEYDVVEVKVTTPGPRKKRVFHRKKVAPKDEL